MNLLIVTGLSGAGKSNAVNCLEDIGFYCIDNMPPAMIKDFIRLSVADRITIEKVAFVTDIRGGEFFDDIKESLAELRENGTDFKIMFLEASNETLIKRFKEMRRRHPLNQEGSLEELIEKERDMLAEVRQMSDYIIDTTNMKTANLQEQINKLFTEGSPAENISITVMSFGHKNGVPLDADFVFDVRFLPNPYYLSSMKKLTGNSKKVQEYMSKFPECKEFVTRVHDLIEDLLPLYAREGKYHLAIAFGCTGGQHRSVAVTNFYADLLEKEGKRVIKVHRDCPK